jgi:hypothetical protein
MRSFDSAEGTRTRCRGHRAPSRLSCRRRGQEAWRPLQGVQRKVVRFTKIGLQIEEPRLVLRHCGKGGFFTGSTARTSTAGTVKMKFPITLANGFKSEAAIVEKVSCGGVATASPERVGKRLARSILRSAGVLPPASTAKVGRMSNMPAIASLAVAAGILQATRRWWGYGCRLPTRYLCCRAGEGSTRAWDNTPSLSLYRKGGQSWVAWAASAP